MAEPGDPEDDGAPEEVVELPLDGRLDLHPFHPRDVKEVLVSYAEACREKGVLELEIVHGKGIGALKRTVEAVLKKMPEVIWFGPADEGRGGWGVTLARLSPLEGAPPRTTAPEG